MENHDPPKEESKKDLLDLQKPPETPPTIEEIPNPPSERPTPPAPKQEQEQPKPWQENTQEVEPAEPTSKENP